MRLRMTVCTAVTVLVLGTLTSAAGATNLPTGDWSIFANGTVGTLHIASVDGAGNLTATAFGNQTIGFYNAVSNQILFLRNQGSLNGTQQYSGGLQVVQISAGACTYALQGSFSAYLGGGGTGSNFSFGWVAIINAPC